MVAVIEGSVIQPALTPSPSIDPRLLEPGWAGDLAPDELDFIHAELSTDKKLARWWGFRPSTKRRPEWAIRQVAMWGDPERHSVNVGLARRQKA